jgi:Glycosyl transferase family 2
MKELAHQLGTDWNSQNDVVSVEADDTLRLWKAPDYRHGSEQGLVGRISHGNVKLKFEAMLEPDTIFVAKIHQSGRCQSSKESCNLTCIGRRAYLASGANLLQSLSVPVNKWITISLAYCDGTVTLQVDGAANAKTYDRASQYGYCFLGIKSGVARLRNVEISEANVDATAQVADYRVLRSNMIEPIPKVSIITTVYDRIQCLEQCISSVRALELQVHEHIVVADAPSALHLQEISNLMGSSDSDSTGWTLAALTNRKNDWGITPAAVGLRLARGRYVCFLSDDNGYKPNHFNGLVHILDGNPNIGFVYSSCLYGGDSILRGAPPRFGRIDLGQPLFRRELFDFYLGGRLPYEDPYWDWHMIERFLQRGVRWRHLKEATFVFRLAKYPHLIAKQDH